MGIEASGLEAGAPASWTPGDMTHLLPSRPCWTDLCDECCVGPLALAHASLSEATALLIPALHTPTPLE